MREIPCPRQEASACQDAVICHRRDTTKKVSGSRRCKTSRALRCQQLQHPCAAVLPQHPKMQNTHTPHLHPGPPATLVPCLAPCHSQGRHCDAVTQEETLQGFTSTAALLWAHSSQFQWVKGSSYCSNYALPPIFWNQWKKLPTVICFHIPCESCWLSPAVSRFPVCLPSGHTRHLRRAPRSCWGHVGAVACQEGWGLPKQLLTAAINEQTCQFWGHIRVHTFSTQPWSWVCCAFAPSNPLFWGNTTQLTEVCGRLSWWALAMGHP